MLQQPHYVIVALSGGVDSAACLCLLKDYPHLVAIYMRNWDQYLNHDVLGHKEVVDGCHDAADLLAVEQICHSLNVKLVVYNFVAEYWTDVFTPTLSEIAAGKTPNPDVWCNQKIKFGKLMEELDQTYGENYTLVTGHYAQVSCENKRVYLKTAANTNKDQTYFLNQLTAQQLAKVYFPLATIANKQTVRAIVAAHNLPVWNKKESMGICFIGKRNYQAFMHNYLPITSGPIVNIVTNQVLGEHQGLGLYTIGQRKGLHLGGQASSMYVCMKNYQTNTLYVCEQQTMKQYLTFSETQVIDFHWINQPVLVNEQVYLRFRHRGELILSTLVQSTAKMLIFAHDKIITTAPGQYVVFYDLSRTYCLGGGVYC